MTVLALASGDGELQADAVEVIYRLLDLRGLDGPARLQAHVRLQQDGGVHSFLFPLASLGDRARFECLFLLTEISHADDRVTERKRAFLSEVQAVFGLHEDQLRSLQSFVSIARALRHRGVAPQVAENILRRAHVRMQSVGIQVGDVPASTQAGRRKSWSRGVGMALAAVCTLAVYAIQRDALVAATVGGILSVGGLWLINMGGRPSLLSLLRAGHRQGLIRNLQDSIAKLTALLESGVPRTSLSDAEQRAISDLRAHRDLLRTLLVRHLQDPDESHRALASTSSVPAIQLDAPQGPKLSYKQVRKQFLDADVLMFRGSRPISRMLQAGARSSYSHCGLLAWWHRRLMLLQAESACIQAVPLSTALHSYPGEVDWYQIRPEVRDPATVLRIIEEAQVNLGLSYAHTDLLRTILHDVAGMQLPEDCEEPRALFCSQYVARCFRLAGLPLHPQSDIETFPSEIALSPVLRFVGTIVPDMSPAEMRALLDRSRGF